MFIADAGLEGENNTIYIEIYNETDSFIHGLQSDNVNTASLKYTVKEDDKPFGHWYVAITNPWDEDHYAGNGRVPMNCRRPYSIRIELK